MQKLFSLFWAILRLVKDDWLKWSCGMYITEKENMLGLWYRSLAQCFLTE